MGTFKSARRVRGLGFQLLITPSATFKASVVVSKKIAPLAVTRNYLRRSVYVALRDIHKQSAVALQSHFIIIFLPESKKISLPDLLVSLKTTIKSLLPQKDYSR